LLRSTRQQLHGQIAAALEIQSPELMGSRPELFAQHYTEAGMVEKSVAYWVKAGRRSAARSAMMEAAAQLQKGLDQLPLLPDGLERQQKELELRSGLGAALMIVKGYAAPETGGNYARARELWEQLGSPSAFLHVPCGQFFYHVNRCEFDVAQRLAEDLLRVSRQHNYTAGLVLGHTCSGRTLMPVGRFASARSHLEQALALYDPIGHSSLPHQVGIDPQVTSQTNLVLVLFCLGFPDQAMAQGSAAVAGARRLAHPPSLALSMGIGTYPLALVGDNLALEERVNELISVAAEHGFPLYSAAGTMYRGWLRAGSGDVVEGISLLRSGLAGYRAAGQEAWMPFFVALQAASCEMAEQIEEGLTLLDEAFRIVERTGERWLEADLYRQKGQLLLQQGHPAAAEELYRQALIIARKQDAKLWELRAAVSLARLRRDQGRHAEARELLAPVYGWFTEGFATPDLREAKALLDDLGGS
jgi:predicted ATPase